MVAPGNNGNGKHPNGNGTNSHAPKGDQLAKPMQFTSDGAGGPPSVSDLRMLRRALRDKWVGVWNVSVNTQRRLPESLWEQYQAAETRLIEATEPGGKQKNLDIMLEIAEILRRLQADNVHAAHVLYAISKGEEGEEGDEVFLKPMRLGGAGGSAA